MRSSAESRANQERQRAGPALKGVQSQGVIAQCLFGVTEARNIEIDRKEKRKKSPEKDQ